MEQVAKNQELTLNLSDAHKYGCSLTLAGYGYPYSQVIMPQMPIQTAAHFDCDVWWHDVERNTNGELVTSPKANNRIADITATGNTIEEAIEIAYRNINKIECPGSYYRTDIGEVLWPPIYD